jgi:hypothetical protein
MAVSYGGNYNSVSEITGPSGWYTINSAAGSCQTYVDQSYDGGGWALVLADRAFTAGMNNLTYVDATTKCNFRTGGTNNGSNTVVPERSKLSGLADYNVFVAPLFWPMLAGRASSGKVTVVQYVSGTNGSALSATGSHNKRYRWRFDSFNSRLGFVGATGISDETGTGAPGLYSYHSNGSYSLSTYDVDQDAHGGNCSTFYNNYPFWYGGCWNGNYFAEGGYADGPYWSGSGSGFQYGAVYIK